MSSAPNGPASFQVIVSTDMSRKIKDLYKAAVAHRIGQQFLDALQKAYEQLHNTADSWGEPLFDLKALGVQVRIGLTFPLVIHYGLNLGLRHVYLARAELTNA